MIELDEATAIVLLDIVETLSGPFSDEEAVSLLRKGRFAHPRLVEAFALAEVDPDEVPMPEIPLMVPGSKAINSPT